jgi:integrator complex subunit 11
MSIKVQTLGAGSEVGRSCFLVSVDDITILVDAGVHLNPATKSDRVPMIPEGIRISGVIITHYHMDHVGALPHLMEVLNIIPKDIEIFMTAPTRTLSPLVCIDYSNGPNSDLYVPNHVVNCFKSSQIKMIGCGEEVTLERCPEFKFHVVYAGHVIGGVMIIFKYKGKTVVYTGDFSVTEHDALLNPITIPPELIPNNGCDAVISESTHATTVDPKKTSSTESQICDIIRKTLRKGGSVLLPVFAVGRTQELAIMIRRQLGNSVRLFTTSPSGHRASVLVSSLHSQWLKSDITVPHNLNIELLDENSDFPNNSVVFASPSMIEGGASLRLFSQVCGDNKNLVLMTGYCNKGTVGNSVILFASRRWTKERHVMIMNTRSDVNCECSYIPLTNHTDSNGIIQVLRQLRPRAGLVLVHGQREKIERFSQRIREERIIDPLCAIEIPRNYETCCFQSPSDCVHTTGRPCSLLMRKLLRVKADFTLEKLANQFCEMYPHFITRRTNNCELEIKDSRSVVIVKLDESLLVLEWSSDVSFGPRWVSRNPLVTCIIHVLELRGFIGETVPESSGDLFSISECSD